jgi:hypothetical protein
MVLSVCFDDSGGGRVERSTYFDTIKTQRDGQIDIALVVYQVLLTLSAGAAVKIKSHFDSSGVAVIDLKDQSMSGVKVFNCPKSANHQCLQVGKVRPDSRRAVRVVLCVVDSEAAAFPALVDT